MNKIIIHRNIDIEVSFFELIENANEEQLYEIAEMIIQRLKNNPRYKWFIESAENEKNTIDAIIKAVTWYYGCDMEKLKSQKKTRELATARMMVMYLLREKTSWSLSKIGRLFCRDHSTVIHAKKTIEGLLKYDSKLQRDYSMIMSKYISLLNENQ